MNWMLCGVTCKWDNRWHSAALNWPETCCHHKKLNGWSKLCAPSADPSSHASLYPGFPCCIMKVLLSSESSTLQYMTQVLGFGEVVTSTVRSTSAPTSYLSHVSANWFRRTSMTYGSYVSHASQRAAATNLLHKHVLPFKGYLKRFKSINNRKAVSTRSLSCRVLAFQESSRTTSRSPSQLVEEACGVSYDTCLFYLLLDKGI